MHDDIKRARLLLQAYLLSIPLWWFLGFDFIVLQVLAALLVLACPDALRRFTLGDYLLVALILVLGGSAYVAGFLIAQNPARFVAAAYNLSFWICGLILAMQIRHLWARSEEGRAMLLGTAHVTFLVVVASCWAVFVLAYAIHNMSLITPSLFGILLGNHIPSWAPLVERYASLVYTLADWGLPGVPMPRVQVFGPYPTATAATVAVLGALSLMYLNLRRPAARLLPAIIEGVIFATIAITLTRSVLGGWVMGAVAANVLFGDTFRRVGATLAAVCLIGLIALGAINLSGATEYRNYSSESRFDSYARAIEETIAFSPVFGLGIKPREESHIAVGSHSTVVSSFTKGGIIGLTFAILFLFLRPAWRWALASMACITAPNGIAAGQQAEMRILFNLQAALWVWLCFEDIDAPATAAALIFVAIALIERTTSPAIVAAAALRRRVPAIAHTGRPTSSGLLP